MQNQFPVKKNLVHLVSIKIVLLICVSMAGSFSSCGATNYDMTDSSISNTTQTLAPATAGTGTGQNGVPNTGNTNISFKDFGYVTDTNVRSNDPSQAADLLPINHSYTVTDQSQNQIQTNSYYSSLVKPSESDANTSGTSITQAPTLNPGEAGRQVNPYLPGSTSTLAPTSSALQGTFMPSALVPIPSGTTSSFGGIAPARIYNGPYEGSVPAASTFNPASFGGANLLPRASYGLVEFSTNN